MFLYKLDFPNGKSYIGITSKTVKQRFAAHCAPANRNNPCQKAIHKYGKENVVVITLANCDNWELLCLAEQEAIEKYMTFGIKGYNLTLGGDGNLTLDLSQDERIARDKAIAKEYQKAYRQANKEKAKCNNDAWRAKNKEYVTIKSKEYAEAHKESIAKAKRDYIERNREKEIARSKKRWEVKKAQRVTAAL